MLASILSILEDTVYSVRFYKRNIVLFELHIPIISEKNKPMALSNVSPIPIRWNT
jgi:hypothetical protein